MALPTSKHYIRDSFKRQNDWNGSKTFIRKKIRVFWRTRKIGQW